MNMEIEGKAIPVTLAASIIGGWLWVTNFFVTHEAAEQIHAQYLERKEADEVYLTRKAWELAYIEMQLTLTNSELRYWEGVAKMTPADTRQYDLLKISAEALMVARNERIGR